MVRSILILFLIFVLLPPVPAFAHSQTQIIEMTATGFVPDSVSVDENATILFVNSDTEARWPASNVHPTHELYPEFDPRQPIPVGDSWTFKPKKIGVWKFHDHLFPHQRGTLTVIKESGGNNNSTNVTPNAKEEEPRISVFDITRNTLLKIIDSIKAMIVPKKNAQPLPSKKVFVGLSSEKQTAVLTNLANDSPQNMWKWFKGVFAGEAGSSGNIHDLAHLTGNILYKKKGFSGIGLCGSEFAFGCYHGFLDEAFAKNLDSLEDAEKACLKLDPKKSLPNRSSRTPTSQVSGPVASCIHGIGHGVASYYLTKDLTTSLKTCRKLINGKEYCYDGVFMEFVRSESDSFFKKNDPLYPCKKLEQDFGYAYSFACGRNQPSLLMSRFRMGFDEVIGICNTSDSDPFKRACFDALGFSLASTGKVETIIEGCQKIVETQFAQNCLKAAAGEMVFQEVPDWWQKSQQICSAAGESRKDCIDHVKRLIGEYGRKITINFTPHKNGEDLNSYVRAQLALCYDNGGRDGCYQQAARVLYDQLGLSKTLTLLKNNEEHVEVYARCHEVTHYLSRYEYQKQKSISKVYAQCDSSCHGGCYHGTLEAYLKDQNIKDENHLTRQFSKGCGKESSYQKPLEFYECLHGLGHAAMFVTDMELFKSLELCDSLKEPMHKEKCYTGVFMENSSSSTSFDHKSKYIKSDDPFYPCNVMDEKYQYMCWQYQSSYFSIINNQDWKKVADMCLKIPQQYQDRCFRTIGTNQVGFTSSLEVMKQNCDLMPNPHYKNICVSGVIVSLSYRFVHDMDKMVSFCSLVDTDYKEGCFRLIGASILDWNANAIVAKQECNKIPDHQGVTWCTNEVDSI